MLSQCTGPHAQPALVMKLSGGAPTRIWGKILLFSLAMALGFLGKIISPLVAFEFGNSLKKKGKAWDPGLLFSRAERF